MAQVPKIFYTGQTQKAQNIWDLKEIDEVTLS